MKKIISIPVYVLVTVLCSMFVISCSEDSPVTPSEEGPYQFDSARYQWTTDTINYPYVGTIFGFDSSHVYILGNHALYIYEGTNYVPQYLGDLNCHVIDGLDPLNVYIAGSYPNGNYRLVKWDGSSFHDILVPSDTSQDIGFTAIFVKSNDEIWLATQGKLFFTNGMSYSEYEIDSTSNITLLTEQDGKILASGRRYLCPLSCDAETNVYQFDNNSWSKIYSERIPYYEYETQLYPVKLGNKLYGNKQVGMFGFANSIFNKLLNSPSHYLIGSLASGKDINQFLTVAFSSNEQFYVNWNGTKWSKEFTEPGSLVNMAIVDNNYYSIISPCPSCNFVLIRTGKPK